MPAIINQATPELIPINANERYIQASQNRAGNAFTLLSNYNYLGTTGPMPDYTWTAPDNNVFNYTLINGELSLNSVLYGSLTTPEKRIFFRYLQKFIGQCLKNYNDAYGL